MSRNLLDKSDIERELGINYRQLRHRLSFLDGIIDEYVHEGKRGAKLFDQNGFEILKRLVELEGDNRTIKEAVNVLSEELNINGDGDQEKVNGNEGRSNDNFDNTLNKMAKEKAILEVETEQLRERVNELKDRVESQKQQIKQLLPPAKEEEVSLKDKTLWQVLREWFKQPVN